MLHVGYINSIHPVDTIMYMLHVTCGVYTVYVHVGYINSIHPIDTIIYMLHVTCGVYK